MSQVQWVLLLCSSQTIELIESEVLCSLYTCKTPFQLRMQLRKENRLSYAYAATKSFLRVPMT
jgi:hypothetical protein